MFDRRPPAPSAFHFCATVALFVTTFSLTPVAPAAAQPSARGVERAGVLPGPLPLFPTDNWWNLDVSQAPVDPASADFIQFIGPTRRLHPDWGNESGATLPSPIIYGIPYVVVSGVEPLEPVTFQYHQESDAGAPARPAGYPIPVEARSEPRWIEGGIPGGGTSGDRHLLIVDRDRRLLYELYALRWDTAALRWRAGSGAVFPLDSNLRRPDGWTSADAAGLAILPGLVRYDEAFGDAPIRHAFRVTVRATNGYVFPASHRAGNTAGALPMGARLRLKASKDISGYSAPLRRIFQAMKTYGLIVADNGSDMYVTGTHDPRWSMDAIVPAFRTLRAEDFEVVQLGWRPSTPPPPPDDADVDDDGLPDEWERRFGLDPGNGAGDEGADGDPDRDGRTNREEWQEGTHPRGTWTRWFAEGVTSEFFATRLALFNASDAGARVLVRVELSDGRVVADWRTMSAWAPASIDVASLGLPRAEFAVRVEADAPVVAERTVSWDARGYGAHADAGVASPSREWHFAEGATHSGFDLFYLLSNPSNDEVGAEVEYLRPGGLPALTRSYTVPPHARHTIWVNREDPELAFTDVSAIVRTDAPRGLVVERAMYRTRNGVAFDAGHGAAGVAAPAARWFLAEGATGPFFDLFVLLSNPGAQPAEVALTYLLPDGRTVSRHRTVPARARDTVWVDHEADELADTAVSVVVETDAATPIVVERAMWWPGGPATWHEAHAAAGATQPALSWSIVDGDTEQGGAQSTYVLVANVADRAGVARVSVHTADGRHLQLSRALPASSRTNVDMAAEFPDLVGVAYGVLVESVGADPVPIVVERASYRDVAGVRWAAGTAALATPLR